VSCVTAACCGSGTAAVAPEPSAPANAANAFATLAFAAGCCCGGDRDGCWLGAETTKAGEAGGGCWWGYVLNTRPPLISDAVSGLTLETSKARKSLADSTPSGVP